MKIEEIKDLIKFAKEEGLLFLKVGDFEIHLGAPVQQQLDLDKLLGAPVETEKALADLMTYSV